MAIVKRGISTAGISQTGIATRGISVVDRVCYAYNFDGIDDRGQLANRAINIEGDNTFEFWSPAVVMTATQAIISQNITSNSASMEFQLFTASGGLEVIYGGAPRVVIMTQAQGFKSSTRYGLTLIGSEAKLYEGGLGGTLVRTSGFTRGTAREPTAPTLIGCRGNGTGAYANFFSGLQYDIKINGVLWEMGDRNQSIQLPTPTGLGAELITQSVLENPASKGSQWAYLGGGRWQYIGDGQGGLQFLLPANIPEQGFIEYEVESYQQVTGVGPMRVSPTTTNFFGDRLFNTLGRKKAYYTVKPASIEFTRNNSGDQINCVIKNISFKPLGTCNPMTIFNTTNDRWQQVPCRINTEGVQVQGGAFITTSDNKKVEVLK